MNPRLLVLLLLVSLVACGAGATAPQVQGPAALPAPGSAPAMPVAAAAPAFPAEDDAAVPVSARNPSWGSRAALVTIVQFSDFQCPFCKRVEPALARVREAYGPENVRIVWKHDPLPFHPNARPAAEAAAGVYAMGGAEAFWRFHAAVFAEQSDMGEDSYVKWAADAGVRDGAAFRAGLGSHRWADAVDADLRDGTALGVMGTPAFFVNGVQVNGAQPFENFKMVIDAELAKARARVEAGTPRERVYAELARENRAAAPKHEEEEDDDREDTTTVFKIPVGGSPVRGNPAAMVTIVEFSDFQCPFCSRVEATLAALREHYKDKVRFVWKNEPLPFHPNAERAAQAALEVRAEKGDTAFWAMHDELFAAQKDLAPDTLARLGAKVGASGDRVRAAVQGHRFARAIAADADLAEDFQANGTPHFFINGRRLVGAQPQEKFEKIIDEEIAHAQGLLAKGTPPAQLYEALVKDGKGPPEPERKPVTAGLATNDPVRGNPAARVTVHEWADFQCPFCGRAEETVGRLLKEYGPRVRLVWHDLPLPMHPDAPLAARAGREAFQQRGSTGFWALHDLMIGDQHKLSRGDLDVYARALGFDLNRWNGALDQGLHQTEIDAEKLVADGMDISGTPAFVIVPAGAASGYFVSGAQPYEKFHKLVERALVEAR